MYRRTIVENPVRNGKIAELCENALLNFQDPILIMTDWIQHANTIYEFLDELQSEAKVVTGNNSASEIEEAIQTLGSSYKILICSPIFTEGVNIPQVKTMIFAFGGKSHIKVLQRVGRGLRKSSDNSEIIIHDFYDETSKYGKRHSYSRKKLYEKESFSVQKI